MHMSHKILFQKAIKWSDKYLEMIASVLLIAIMIFIHIYRLADIPYGIDVDEMGMGYDAYCLANYGVDRYLKSFPLYLINFSGGQSSMYAYLCAPFVKIFGLSVLTMRIPAFLFSIITAIFGYKIIDQKWPNNRNMRLLFLFLYTVLPVFTMLHRIGLDCNLSLGLTTVFLFYLIKAIDTGKIVNYIVSGILCGFVLYTYALNYFLLPLLLIFTFIYLIYLKKINLKKVIAFALPLGALAAPLIMIQVINIFDLSEMKMGIFTLPRLYRYRGEDISFQSFVNNLPGIWKSLFLYDGVNFNSIDGFYTMYLISIPFILIGIAYALVSVIRAIKQKEWDISFLMVSLLIVEIILGCILNEDGPNVYRLNSTFITLIYFLIMGIDVSYKLLKKKFNAFIGKASIILIMVGYITYFAAFMGYYFGDYKEDTYLIPLFQHTFEEALSYLENEVDEQVTERTTYIGDLNQTYIYYLGSTMISPYEYNKLEVQDNQHLWDWAAKYKNYDFNLPETIDLNGNYIVVDTNEEYRKRLNDLGFECEQREHYYIFTHPWQSYEISNENKYAWNLGADATNTVDFKTAVMDVQGVQCLVLVGWSFNGKTENVWEDVFITAGNKTYHPEKADRSDVAEQYGNQNILNCGMVFAIPIEDLSDIDTLKLVGVDTKSKVVSEVLLNVVR